MSFSVLENPDMLRVSRDYLEMLFVELGYIGGIYTEIQRSVKLIICFLDKNLVGIIRIAGPEARLDTYKLFHWLLHTLIYRQ